jgi:glycosyltransferase involved in cell wall biosynthesis
MTARIWIDVGDLFIYAAAAHRPSGIQRLEFELCRALVALLESKDRVFFVRHDEQQQSLVEVTWEAVELLFEEMSDSSHLQTPNKASAFRTALLDMLPSDLRKFLSHQKQAMAGLVRSLRHRWRSRTRDPIATPDFAARPGDILAVFGAPWISSDYHSYDRKAVCEKGLRFAVLIHDLIPLRRHDWFGDGVIKGFQAWFEDAIQLADVILTNSVATAADVSAYARKAGLALSTAPTPIPIGTGFTTRQKGASVRSTRLPPPDTYALCVSTIEIRKNHALLVRVWQLLLDNMPPESVPTLVFAGRVGWLVSDLMQQLRNSNFLHGKIVHVDGPTDEELEALYDGCLFTLYPSFYEGWGLPVTESHSFGRPCIASNATSLPEAGGALARYIDPDNATGAYRVIRETIEDRAGLRKWRDEVQRDFRPVSWRQSAEAVMRELDFAAINLRAAV